MAEIANSHAEHISKIMQNTTIPQIGVLGMMSKKVHRKTMKKIRNNMEDNEKRFEQDIETWLTSPTGGWTKNDLSGIAL